MHLVRVRIWERIKVPKSTQMPLWKKKQKTFPKETHSLSCRVKLMKVTDMHPKSPLEYQELLFVWLSAVSSAFPQKEARFDYLRCISQDSNTSCSHCAASSSTASMLITWSFHFLLQLPAAAPRRDKNPSPSAAAVGTELWRPWGFIN